MFAAAYAALFEGSYSCSRHLIGSLVRPSDDVIIDIGAGQRGRDSNRGGDEETVRWNEFDEPVQAVVANVGSWDLTYFWMSSVEVGRRRSAR